MEKDLAPVRSREPYGYLAKNFCVAPVSVVKPWRVDQVYRSVRRLVVRVDIDGGRAYLPLELWTDMLFNDPSWASPTCAEVMADLDGFARV